MEVQSETKEIAGKDGRYFNKILLKNIIYILDIEFDICVNNLIDC